MDSCNSTAINMALVKLSGSQNKTKSHESWKDCVCVCVCQLPLSFWDSPVSTPSSYRSVVITDVCCWTLFYVDSGDLDSGSHSYASSS
ncbi:hypothetical protein STEG23_005329 [Scotinomys teguina]